MISLITASDQKPWQGERQVLGWYGTSHSTIGVGHKNQRLRILTDYAAAITVNTGGDLLLAGNTSVVLNQGDHLELQYVSSGESVYLDGKWVEVSRSINH